MVHEIFYGKITFSTSFSAFVIGRGPPPPPQEVEEEELMAVGRGPPPPPQEVEEEELMAKWDTQDDNPSYLLCLHQSPFLSSYLLAFHLD